MVYSRYEVHPTRIGTKVNRPDWEIHEGGEVIEVHDTKERAVERAKSYSKSAGGGVEIYDTMGRLNRSHSYDAEEF